MVPPPAALIVAVLPTCQKTFLACAPLVRMTLRGAPDAPTVSVLAIWNTQIALASPCASKVRSDPVIMNEPAAALYMSGSERQSTELACTRIRASGTRSRRKIDDAARASLRPVSRSQK